MAAMTRQGWKDFLHSLERSPALQRELNACKDINDVLDLGMRCGFAICLNDLKHDAQAESIAQWFKLSTIQ